ncbi:MAG: ATP synthase F0 subunit A [Omnitrophica WOR_2 bacterium GWF2_43_52]|nr:MAG: ATP synthase F0 subunit A [Omnitrophica WOR_2 bacterium GWA2_44_7]OGX20762.1 MAG: ATP synthase F0 subunit A [Omnitrophica WOR_2 bacterium GWF2_43_52]HAH19785.1 ATP synthase F0 subunit A [Candidatus Omnitrophota bacterium]HBG63410.1 ATP synthase F0 subunit A [Candidatus Omnitrophota bacterium]
MSGSESSSQELANFIGITVKGLGDSGLGIFLHRWENVIFSLIAVVFLSLMAYFAQRNRSFVPERRLQNMVEVLVESLSNFVSGVLGEKEGRHYLPYIGTLFLYILIMNFMGMVPGMKSPTSSLNTTVALALCTFIYVQYTGIRRLGMIGYLDHMAGSPRMPEEKGVFKIFLILLFIPIHILLFIIHIIGEFVKPVSLSLRLFGNITGEDALLYVFVMLGLSMFSAWKSPVGFPLQIPIMFLSLIGGAVQAMVFSLLSAVYISMMLPHHEEVKH